jgi:hypothetical protein
VLDLRRPCAWPRDNLEERVGPAGPVAWDLLG